MSWCIYKHTNKINGKVYIGQTCQKPEERWGSKGQNYDTAFAFGKAIVKYGWDNFEHEIIEDNINTLEEANQKEIEYIAKFHSYIGDIECNGYNSTKGGDNGDHTGIPVYQIDSNMHIINKFVSSAEAERKLGIKAQNIGQCLLGNQITAGGYFWANIEQYDAGLWKVPCNKKERAVVQISVDSLQILNIYKSIKEAAEKTGISYNCIYSSCNGDYIMSHGYYWCFEDMYSSSWEPRENRTGKWRQRAVICHETKEIYESITECSKVTGISTSNLSQNCCANHRMGKGKHYAWLDDYDENWEPAEPYNTEKRKLVSTLKKPVWCEQTHCFYNSATEAGITLDIDVRSICRVCSGELIQTHGYNFCWKEDWYDGWRPRESKQGQHLNGFSQESKEKMKTSALQNKGIRIAQYSKEGELISEYNNYEEGQNATGVKKDNIGRSVRTNRKRDKNFATAGGYIWKEVKNDE